MSFTRMIVSKKGSINTASDFKFIGCENVMKLQKTLSAFGMIGALSFFLEDILGTVLWRGYNPITSYMSELTADGALNVLLTRVLFYIYEICLMIFFAAMCVKAFKIHGVCLKIGYGGLFIIAAISFLGFGLFPMTMNFIKTPKDLIHLIITIFIIAGTILSLFLLAFGYRKQGHGRKIGRITMLFAVLFLLFNLMHLYAIFNDSNILGLLQRLGFYTFQIYIFRLSWYYAAPGNQRKSAV